jgi:hypothetical protein
MNNEFIPYEQALELKDLGFDKPCFAFYDESLYFPNNENQYGTFCNQKLDASSCSAPTFSQAFRWFREKEFYCIVYKNYDGFVYEIYGEGLQIIKEPFNTYEEAELACLKRLIEIVKQPKN